MKKLSLLMAALAFSTQALAATTLKIASIAPDGTSWMNEMRAGAETIKNRTEGRVTLKFYPGGVMGNDQAVLKKMKIGQINGGALTAGSLATIEPDAQIYSLPILFRNQAEVNFVRPQIDPIIGDKLAAKGMVVLGISDGGFAYYLSNKPLHGTDDLKGEKAWLPNGDVIGQTFYEAIDVTPVTLPLADVYTGLQTGLINTVTSTTTGAIAFQWHTKVKYMTTEPLLYVTGMLVVDAKAFNKISPADQAIVREVMGQVFHNLDEINRHDNEMALQALKDQGIVMVDLNEQELTAWRAIANRTSELLGQKKAYSQELYAKIEILLNKYRHDNP